LKIDIHAHEFPENYLREIHRMVERGEFPEVAETLTPWRIDDHLALMEREGVDMQVLSLAAARYVEDRPQARALARMVNEAFADAAAKHPGKFVAFACVPLPSWTTGSRSWSTPWGHWGCGGSSWGRTSRASP
jgi:predicted TIM-barrel fold metal-dependent hydrolase